MITNMSKQKVKVEVTNTYYFTPEQWSNHDQVRSQGNKPINEYLEDVCLPHQTRVEIDLSDISNEEGENGDKKDVLFG